MTTDNTQRDLIEDLEHLSKQVSYIDKDLRDLEKADNLFIMDTYGTNGDLCIAFDKDSGQSLRLLVKTHLETQKTDMLCKISRIVDQLLKKD